MASGGHLLAQQSQGVETQIKTLINADLKEICRAFGYQVSGTKAQLQTRCSAILRELVKNGDAKAFEDLRYRASHHGRAQQSPGPISATNNYSSGGVNGQHSMAPNRPVNNAARLPKDGKYFKSSPFYEILDTLMPLQDLPEMPQNRHTVRASLTLNQENAQRLVNDESLKVLLYCGSTHGMSAHSPVDIAFPNQIEVKVNNDDVKSNFKGLKNKPGSTKPAELTSLRYKPGYQNQLTITYALTTKRYAFVVYLVRYVTAATLTDRIKSASVIPRQKVIDEMNKANADPDIEATSTRMSLKDPISTVRISLPVRSTFCAHPQCFDGAMFMQLQEQAPQWACPLCGKHVPFQSLCVDKYFEDILNRTSQSIEKVDVEPNGEWKVIKEDEEKQPNGTSSKPRASYDDDFDDDLVEVADPTNKHLNGLKRESQPPNILSPVNGTGVSMNTPPLSSREPSVAQSTASVQRPSNKRSSASVTIDLTLSDDEDEQPPRPAKRQATATNNTTSNASSSHRSYHTPASLPDQNQYRTPFVPQRQADSYRPPSNAGSDSYRPSSHMGSDSYRPPSHTGPSLPPPSPFANLGSPSLLQSPLRTSNSYTGNSGGAWSAQPSRPPSHQPHHTPQPPSYSMRAPSAEAHHSQDPPTPQQHQQQQGSDQLRLPPMQTHPLHGLEHQYQQQTSGWRNDYGGGSYSASPGG